MQNTSTEGQKAVVSYNEEIEAMLEQSLTGVVKRPKATLAGLGQPAANDNSLKGE